MIGSIRGGSGGMDMAALKQMQQNMFKSIDANKDGKINKDELSSFQKTQQSNGMTGGPSVDEIFTNSDSNSDGNITSLEFESSMAKLAQQMQDQLSTQGQEEVSSEPGAKMKKMFEDLGSALKSGDLDAAKKALAELQQNAPDQSAGATNPMSAQIDSLSKALDSGDLKGAQEAYSTIQDMIAQGPQGMMASGGGQSQVSSKIDDLLNTLLAALSNDDDAKSSSTTNKEADNKQASTTSEKNATDLKNLLQSAIQTYLQMSSNSNGQNAANSSLMSSSLFG